MTNLYGQPTRGDMSSGGSLSDRMYKNIACEGTYHPVTGRYLRRKLQREIKKQQKKLNKLQEKN